MKELIGLVQKLPKSGVDEAIKAINEILDDEKDKEKKEPKACPHCGSEECVKNGHQHDGKQRYRCTVCGCTFVETGNGAMYESHYGEAVWEQAIKDTLGGVSIDGSARALHMSHKTMFYLRHKILMALEDEEKEEAVVLDGVCEIDDAYVLESLKGTEIPREYGRKARKHGAKAEKAGVSDEYVNICTGVEREGKAYARSMGRATPTSEEITDVYTGHIAKSALVICDGEKSYNILPEICHCAVREVKRLDENDKNVTDSFYNINTVNSYHAFIKERYGKYRGVATKYLNRYNAMFDKAFRNADPEGHAGYKMLPSGYEKYHHTYKDVRESGLLRV
jgi:transposase-like protein